MIGENEIVEEDELILPNQSDGCDSETEDEENEDPNHYLPKEKKPTIDYDFIPLEYKKRVVSLAKLHPTYILKTLQKKGASRLRYKQDIKRWEEDVKKGGTKQDKFTKINSFTYQMFKEARENYEQVTTRNLQKWAMAAAFPLQSNGFHFTASHSWVAKFKNERHITQRKITKYISTKDARTLEQTLESAEKFRTQARKLMINFDADYIINTDQTGCQYQSTIDRSLAHRGVKSVLVKKNVNKLVEDYKNVEVTCSNSGKLTTKIYISFLESVLKPFVKDKHFLLLVDSWGGQTNPSMYDEIFFDSNGGSSCSLKVIPPKCTALCQPCDIYFYRQVKNFVKRLQNCSLLLEEQRDIASREDVIKIHSLVHHQMSAPIFYDMIKYAWYGSKLTDERKYFLNVNDVCFPLMLQINRCHCGNCAFAICSWCRQSFCFICFYDKYHPRNCSTSSEIWSKIFSHQFHSYI